jgi:hypothetical protein
LDQILKTKQNKPAMILTTLLIKTIAFRVATIAIAKAMEVISIANCTFMAVVMSIWAVQGMSWAFEALVIIEARAGLGFLLKVSLHWQSFLGKTAVDSNMQ